ncbi:sugar ABC transporter permease [Bacillus alkalicellulosilyticus]|uniref:sugar ABC transporter permease n=1 Tax=Alkalihalobacterium alkalicellulosilyticum TaxID=1912214 RepID=UPI000997341A|nr:sugar ABC transporter permease [Bacillus alkalicellulosilyticus]
MSNSKSEERLPHKKGVLLATLLSVIFPGLGQFKNRRYIKGAIFFLFSASFLLALMDFITDGYWGIVTLGTDPAIHDSRFLLINGILAIFLTVLYLFIYVWNIKDAQADAEKLAKGWRIPSIKESFHNSYDKAFPYFLVLPGFFMLMLTVVLPLLFLVFVGFTNYSRYNAPPRNLLDWVGFENFVQLITVPIWRETFISVLSWTLVWTFVATTLQIALALFLAILVNDNRVRFKRLIRTVFILPWAVPGFVSILIFSALFHESFGAINRDIIQPILGMNIAWMSDPNWTRTAIIMLQVWLGFPYVFALFTGVLQSVSKDWYEAAEIDGANGWQKFRTITLPHVLFATAPLLIMQYSFNFNNFNIIYLFNEGGPAVRGQNAGGTDILISWVFSLTFQNQQFGMAAVVSVIMGIFVATFAFFQFRRSRSFKEEGKI